MMLDLIFGVMLATAGLNDPLAQKGLDDRTRDDPAAQVAGIEPSAGGIAPGEPTVIDVVITEIEKRILRDYFAQHPCAVYGNCDAQGDLPPGLAKKDHPTPGHAKQLARTGTLPPGLAKRDLPDDLVAALPPRSANQRFVIVDERVMLIERWTNVILDTLEVVSDANLG